MKGGRAWQPYATLEPLMSRHIALKKSRHLALKVTVPRQSISTDYNLKLKAIVAGSGIEGKTMPRMKILNSVEREVFESPPIFNSAERKRCFDFPAPLQDIAASLRTATIDNPVKHEEFLNAVAHGSAAAWEHVNLLGEYDLSEEKFRDSVGIKPPKLTD